MKIELDRERKNVVSIRVVGVGGGGGNAVDHMYDSSIGGVEFIAINTDLHALQFSKATYKLNIGNKLTKGMGAGGRGQTGDWRKSCRRKPGRNHSYIIATIKKANNNQKQQTNGSSPKEKHKREPSGWHPGGDPNCGFSSSAGWLSSWTTFSQ